MAPQSYQLVMRTGPNPGKTYPIDKDEITIGRDIGNDVVINDAEVSRHHARMVKQAGSYVLEDTGSTNGTFVNGQRLMGPHMLRPGELILLGENVGLVFEPAEIDVNATRASRPSVPSMPPSPVQSYTAPPAQPRMTAQPSYSGTVPPGPAEEYEIEEEEEKRSRTWLFAGCGCLVLLLLVVIVGAFVFDYLNLYCQAPFNVFFSGCP